MKKSFFSFILASTMIVGSASVDASSVEFHYMMLDTDIEVIGFDPAALQIKFVNPMDGNITLEGVIAFGISDDDITFTDGVDTISLGVGLGTMIGIFARMESATGSSALVYGHLGFVQIEYDFSISATGTGSSFSADASEDDTGIAFGFGVLVPMSDQAGITLEYNQLPDVDLGGTDLETTSLSIGYQMKI